MRQCAQVQVPIAIVGIGCRFPGGANSPEELWQLLSEGRDAWSEVPKDRFNETAFHHPNQDVNGTISHRGGHFLTGDISRFDPSFFGISSIEAQTMDPQQRLQLETAFEALENAGMTPNQIRGTDTSVHMAIFARDYDRMMYKDTEDLGKYHMTGIGEALLSNRISYVFDLKGPSMTIDTGCSGSMVALHNACRSLENGESSLALVGASNLILSPDQMMPMTALHILNPQGRCFTFDSRGSGYGRGEGAACLVLKRLDAAIEDGDPIRAVIRGTGVNHDGKTSGIALPNQDAQEQLARSVYKRAALDPHSVEYVEAHGTGTAAGDRIETASISNVFCKGRTNDTPLVVGSVKTNIGHLESASGIAGIIKTVLMLEKGSIPANLNFEDLKPDINFNNGEIRIAHRLEEWPMPRSGERLASVNSFGYGGMNAHAVLSSYTLPEKASSTSAKLTLEANGITSSEVNPFPIARTGPELLVVTAESQKALTKQMEKLQHWAKSRIIGEKELRSLIYTLQSRRALMNVRRCAVVPAPEQLLSTLQDMVPKNTLTARNLQIAFVFTGQGAQWIGMGRELMTVHSNFRDSMRISDKMLQILSSSQDQPLRILEELLLDGTASKLNQSEIAQPAVTALQIALVDLLKSCGITPKAVVGHSSGEIAAAYAAGALTHLDAMRASYHRAFISGMAKKHKIEGAMMAVGLGEAETLRLMQLMETPSSSIQVACVNSPESTTVSGDRASILQFQSILVENGVFNRRLQVDTAYHSYHMQRVAGEYQRRLGGMRSADTLTARFLSSVTGSEKSTEFGAAYWVSNLVSQVRFADALAGLSDSVFGAPDPDTAHVFIEIGPHSALSGPLRQTLKTREHVYIPTLVRGKHAVASILETVGRAFELGAEVRFEGLSLAAPYRAPAVMRDLPPYAWDHEKSYWHESRLSKEHRFRRFPYHDLLGIRVPAASPSQPVWRNIISQHHLPWLRDHVIDNTTVFPGSGYLCMAIEALRQILTTRNMTKPAHEFVLRDITFSKALIVPELPVKIEIQISLHLVQPSSDRMFSGWEEFRVSSISSDGIWTEHCTGLIACEFEAPQDSLDLEDEPLYRTLKDWATSTEDNGSSGYEEVGPESFYDQCRSVGNAYGSTFANLQKVGFKDLQAFATIITPDIARCMPSAYMQPHVLHPATLDTVMQASLPLYLEHCSKGSMMPVSIDELFVSAKLVNVPGTELHATTVLRPSTIRSATFDTNVFQMIDSDRPLQVIRLSNCELRGVGHVELSDLDMGLERKITYRMEWRPDITFDTKNTQSMIESPLRYDDVAIAQRAALLDSSASLYMIELLTQLDKSNSIIVAQHHKLLIGWIKNYVLSDRCEMLTANSEDAAVIHGKAASASVAGEMIRQTGSRLFDIVTGQVDALTLMLENDLLYRVYSDDSAAKSYSHLVQYLKHYTFKKPYLKVLEIGAGTGATTQALLEAHADNGNRFFGSYDFSDISSSFFDHAQSRFEGWRDVLRFQTLDIEKDPVAQGFRAQDYDMIIASNVIHATKSIGNSLSNIRKLLKPGGQLALIEEVQLTPTHMVTFGLLPGWWAGLEDNRKQGPLLGTHQWDKVLLETGFSGATIVKNDFEGSGQRASLIISETVTPTLSNGNVHGHSSIKFLAQDLTAGASEFRDSLFSELRTQGASATMIDWPCVDDIDESTYVLLDIDTDPMLLDPSEILFSHISDLVMQPSKVLWVTGGRPPNGAKSAISGLVTGFARIARAENSSLNISVLDIQQDIMSGQTGIRHAIVKILQDIVTSAPELRNDIDHIYRNGQLLVPRLVPDHKANAAAMASGAERKLITSHFHQFDRPLHLDIAKPGLLDSMRFIDDANIAEPLDAKEVVVQTMAHGINFKDVYIALGQMKPGVRMSGECAGTIVAVGRDCTELQVGDRVCVFDAAPFASQARVPATNVHKIPDSMSFVEAASVPVVFATAYYGLVEVARLRTGQSVLIHSAAGGVGQAAIKIAQDIGALIYATVSTDAKRQLLIDEYSIPSHRIFSSRTRQFKTDLLRLTENVGVDVVLNSLAGESLQASWSCIAPFGTFVEIGKSDIYKKGSLRMDVFDRNVTFASVDLSLMSKVQPQAIQRLMNDVFDLFENKRMTPIQPITTYDMGEIEHAFRLIQSGKHTGKVVLLAGEDSLVKTMSPKPPELDLNRNGTYVISGGLGDLGKRIACFLAQHGAGGILLLSRRDPRTVDPSLLSSIQSYGSQVEVAQCDINDKTAVIEAIEGVRNTMPPVRGVVQAAMVLQDRLIGQMNAEDWRASVSPKIQGTQNLLDSLQNAELDFVVMLSSLTTIVGLQGQANYASGNAFLDCLANSYPDPRTQFVSLNLTMIEESEVIALHQERLTQLVRRGCIPLKTSNFLSLLNYVLGPEGRKEQVRQIVIGMDRESAGENSSVAGNPMFSLLPHTRFEAGQVALSKPAASIGVQVREATSQDEALAFIMSGIKDRIAVLMAMSVIDIPVNNPIIDLGMDSLIAIELKNWIGGQLKAALQTSEILDMPSLTALANAILTRSSLLASKDKAKESSLEDVAVDQAPDAGAQSQATNPTGVVVPQLPLPNLDASAKLYLEWVETFCDTDQLVQTRKSASSFLVPNGIGQQLQERLRTRIQDPSIDAWQYDLYTDHVYRKARLPVNPFQHFAAGFRAECERSTSQAQQAARIAAAAYEFKMRVNEGLKPDVLNEQPLCMESVDWIFNCTREPHPHKDLVKRYPASNHCIVLRNGHLFQVPLADAEAPITWEHLEDAFDAIIHASNDSVDTLAPLAAGDRDAWTKHRELLISSSTHNSQVLEIIESSAFNICLDDDAPTGATERSNHFLLRGTTNGWSDKTLQFIVCANGASAILAEHTHIDGGILQQLNEHLYKRLTESTASTALTNGHGNTVEHVISDSIATTNGHDGSNGYAATNGHELSNGHAATNGHGTTSGDPKIAASSFHRLEFDSVPTLLNEARIIQRDFATMTAPLTSEIGIYAFPLLSATIFRDRGYAPRAACQVVIQLAARIYFGEQVPSWETVSLRAFHRGRVDIIQTVLPSMYKFCSAALQDSEPTLDYYSELRALFVAATQAHTVNVTRASRGLGFAGHFYALQEVLREDEDLPDIFADPTYQRTRPAKLMTDCADWTSGLMMDGGWVMPYPDHVWVHYEVMNEEAKLYVKAPVGCLTDFYQALERAAGIIGAVLDVDA